MHASGDKHPALALLWKELRMTEHCGMTFSAGVALGLQLTPGAGRGSGRGSGREGKHSSQWWVKQSGGARPHGRQAALASMSGFSFPSQVGFLQEQGLSS